MATRMESGIVSHNAAELVAFYIDGLGFRERRVLRYPQGTVHRLVLESAECKIFQPADAPQPKPAHDSWSHFRGFAYAALHVDDAAAMFQRAVAAGASVIAEPYSPRPDATVAIVADPHGNVLEILQEARQTLSKEEEKS